MGKNKNNRIEKNNPSTNRKRKFNRNIDRKGICELRPSSTVVEEQRRRAQDLLYSDTQEKRERKKLKAEPAPPKNVKLSKVVRINDIVELKSDDNHFFKIPVNWYAGGNFDRGLHNKLLHDSVTICDKKYYIQSIFRGNDPKFAREQKDKASYHDTVFYYCPDDEDLDIFSVDIKPQIELEKGHHNINFAPLGCKKKDYFTYLGYSYQVLEIVEGGMSQADRRKKCAELKEKFLKTQKVRQSRVKTAHSEKNGKKCTVSYSDTNKKKEHQSVKAFENRQEKITEAKAVLQNEKANENQKPHVEGKSDKIITCNYVDNNCVIIASNHFDHHCISITLPMQLHSENKYIRKMAQSSIGKKPGDSIHLRGDAYIIQEIRKTI